MLVARPAARAIAEALPEPVAAAVIDLITGPLLISPKVVGKPLRHELAGLWSARRGTFFGLYRPDDARHEVVVLRIHHRRHVYRRR